MTWICRCCALLLIAELCAIASWSFFFAPKQPRKDNLSNVYHTTNIFHKTTFETINIQPVLHFAVHVATVIRYPFIVHISKTSYFHMRFPHSIIESFAGTVINNVSRPPFVGRCGDTMYIHQKQRIRFVNFDVSRFCNVSKFDMVEDCGILKSSTVGRPLLTSECGIFNIKTENSVILTDVVLREEYVGKVLITTHKQSRYNHFTLVSESRLCNFFIRSSRTCEKSAPTDFSVLAILASFNDGDIIRETVKHLLSQGVRVHLIDNWSTDGSIEKLKGINISVEMYPQSPIAVYNWTGILQRKEEIASRIQAHWYIHTDADEVRESPWPGVNLRDALYFVDCLGFNKLDFTLVTFSPIDNGFMEGQDPVHYFKWARLFDASVNAPQRKAWKQSHSLDLVSSGGHDAKINNERTFPINFLLRHYPIRSQIQGHRKIFLERKARWSKEERERGWHTHYDHFNNETKLTFSNPEAIPGFFEFPYQALRKSLHLHAALYSGRELQRGLAHAEGAQISICACGDFYFQRVQIISGIILALEEGLNMLLPRLTSCGQAQGSSCNPFRQRCSVLDFEKIFNSSRLEAAMLVSFDMKMGVLHKIPFIYKPLDTGPWLPTLSFDNRVTNTQNDIRIKIQEYAHTSVLQLSACLHHAVPIDHYSRSRLWNAISHNLIFSDQILNSVQKLKYRMGTYIGIDESIHDRQEFCHLFPLNCSKINESHLNSIAIEVYLDSIRSSDKANLSVYIAGATQALFHTLRAKEYRIFSKVDFLDVFTNESSLEQHAALEQAVLEECAYFVGRHQSLLSFMVHEKRLADGLDSRIL